MGSRAENNWVFRLCEELLLVEDVNCIGVDWRNGSGSILQYVQAANNGRVVGAEIAYFLKGLQEKLGYPPSNVHIIGSSLGAHVAGEAGRRLPGIRRITGLDPPRLYFKSVVEEVRLDSSDAGFVDVIHTDTAVIIGLGIAKPIGHFDFYPNGGKHMTGCPKRLAFPWIRSGYSSVNAKKSPRGSTFMKDTLKTFACNHIQAFHYYMHSIRFPGGFVSYPCNSYKDFTSGSCFPCPLQRCPTMGHHSEEYYNIKDQKMKLYLNTGGDPQNFSSWRYYISLTLNGMAETSGKMYISLYGAGGNMTKRWLGSDSLVPGKTYSVFIDSSVMLHPLDHVTFHWTPIQFNNFMGQLGASRINMQSREDGTISSYCAAGTVLANVMQFLGPCSDLDAP